MTHSASVVPRNSFPGQIGVFPRWLCEHKRAFGGLPIWSALARLTVIMVAGLSLLVSGSLGRAQSKPTIRFLVVPHLAPPWHPTKEQRNERLPGQDLPLDQDIIQFLNGEILKSDGKTPYPDHPTCKDFVENSESQLLDPPNREFAQQVMGQKPLIRDACEFSRLNNVSVRIRFLNPATWFDDVVAEYESGHGPVAAYIGDSWLPYFGSRGAIIGTPQRLTWDVRVLFFRKDNIQRAHHKAGDFDTTAGFLHTCEDLHKQGFMPLGIASTADPDLLWGWLAPALSNAGGDVITREGKPFFWLGTWRESGLTSEPASEVCTNLIRLRRRGCLDSQELSNSAVADAFLKGDLSFCLLEPFIAWRARAGAFGINWTNVIGGSLPPSSSGAARRTFLGGSMLAVLGQPADKGSGAATDAQKWVEYLRSDAVQKRHVEEYQYIPSSENAWESPKIADVRRFYQGSLNGTGYDGTLASLQRINERREDQSPWHPAYTPDWPITVEGPESIGRLHQFMSLIRALPAGIGVPNSVGETGSSSTLTPVQREVQHQDEFVRQSLRAAAVPINERLSPGTWSRTWPWLLTIVIVIGVVLVASALFYRRRLRNEAERARAAEQRAEIAEKQLHDLNAKRKRNQEMIAMLDALLARSGPDPVVDRNSAAGLPADEGGI